MMRCAGCGQNLDRSDFSKNQRREKGEGEARCRVCVQECIRDGGVGTARRNFATRFTYGSLDYPWAQGTFRYVQTGRYTGGERTGQPCVIKWFKESAANLDSSYYDKEEQVADEAIRLVDRFNEANIIGKYIRVNRPETWTFGDHEGSGRAGHYFSVEPFIDDFCKFNSNTGWVNENGTDWVAVMQALSHFSYAYSSGSRLLCDLQGGLYRDGAILTDPVVMSNQKGKFGPTDLGPDGMSTFFAQHKCTPYCRRHWPVPQFEYVFYTTTARTTMEGRGGFGGSRYVDDDDDDGYFNYPY